jgi:quinol monooxygenase YgiN
MGSDGPVGTGPAPRSSGDGGGVGQQAKAGRSPVLDAARLEVLRRYSVAGAFGQKREDSVVPDNEPANEEVVVVAIMSVAPDRRDQVRAALLRQVARVHAEEPGAQLFAAHEADEADAVFVLIEKWDSSDSLQSHTTGGAITEFRAVLIPSLLKPTEIHVLKPLPTDDSRKGRL